MWLYKKHYLQKNIHYHFKCFWSLVLLCFRLFLVKLLFDTCLMYYFKVFFIMHWSGEFDFWYSVRHLNGYLSYKLLWILSFILKSKRISNIYTESRFIWLVNEHTGEDKRFWSFYKVIWLMKKNWHLKWIKNHCVDMFVVLIHPNYCYCTKTMTAVGLYYSACSSNWQYSVGISTLKLYLEAMLNYRYLDYRVKSEYCSRITVIVY